MNRSTNPTDLTEGRYWIAKLPAYIYDEWLASSDTRTHLGDIQIVNLNGAKRMRLTLRNNEPGAPEHVPIVMKSMDKKTTFPTFVFTEGPTREAPQTPSALSTTSARYIESDRTFKMEEKLKGIVEVRPDPTPEYQAFNLQRLKLKQDELAASIPMPTFRTDISMTSLATVHQEAAALRKIEKKEASAKADKRSRSDANEVYTKLVHLFSIKPHWTFQELVEHTDQPKNHLQDIVKMYCNKDDETKLYSLKAKEDTLIQ